MPLEAAVGVLHADTFLIRTKQSIEKSTGKSFSQKQKKRFCVQECRKRTSSASVIWHVVLSRQEYTDRPITLLSRCQQAMKPQGKVLLVERVILTGSTPQLLVLVLVLESDVQMLALPGGKERTDAEYGALLSAAGFELTRLIPVLPPFYVIEALRV